MSKTIPGFSDYTISKNGTVKGSDGNVVKARKDKDGYLRVDLYKNKKRYTKFVHSLVSLAYGNGAKETDHKNNNRTDNRASNLEGVSHKENMKRLSQRSKKGK